MQHTVTDGKACCGRTPQRLTAEERVVLAAIERTGNPHRCTLPAADVSTAMIWLEHLGRITTERLPLDGAPRGVWVDYAVRLGLDPADATHEPPATIDEVRRLIGSRRLWTTHVPAEGKAAA